MTRRRAIHKPDHSDKPPEPLPVIPEEAALSISLDENIALIKSLFADDDTVRYREISSGGNMPLRFCVIFCDGLVNSMVMNEHVIEPILDACDLMFEPSLADSISSRLVTVNSATKTRDLTKVVESVTYGDALLLAEGIDEALTLDTKGFETRSNTEPASEKILSGPREGFSEAILKNLALLHRRLRTNDLKMKFSPVGTRTKTQICLCYLDSLVNKTVLQALEDRLKVIQIDGVLDTNYLYELTSDAPLSPFRTMGQTERPDVVASKLLEGRVALFVDGSPVALTAPYLFIENFQSNEDYYQHYYYTSFSRWLRILAFFLTIAAPALSIAVVGYHHEMIPASMMVNMAAARQNVPLPAALEAFIMLVVFDLLRETGIRMPTGVGQALSIVGSLVIGQAAVEAKLVAAPMIIMVAVTGITSLLVPRMNAAVLVLRFALLALAACMGFFGLMIGLSLLLIHVLGLSSCGVWQCDPSSRLAPQDMKDIFVRAPWKRMLIRPSALSFNRTRQVRAEDGDDE